ncbi:MAG: hypothetical protein R3A12_04435 [Ignavibacteria bacterium]
MQRSGNTTVDKKTSEISGMNSSTSSDSLILTFLNTYDSTEYIMGYYAAYVPGPDSNRQDKNKLKEFGSVYADSLTIEFSKITLIPGYSSVH